MDEIQIDKHRVGQSHSCFIIAEVAQAHDGSLGTAHAYIDAAARAGVNAVKFQTHIAAAESTSNEPWRVKFSPQDNTRFDYWRRMEFTEEQWSGLKRHADQLGLVFLSSPFSTEAVDLLERIGTSAWKIASGEVTNRLLLEHIATTKKPCLLSSGMSTLDELGQTVSLLRAKNIPLVIFQCTTAYPCPPEKIGLELIASLRERFKCPIGLSDHSGTIYASLAAATLGANLLEVHITFSRETFGPDVRASVTIDELRTLVEGVRFIERALGAHVNKNAMAAELSLLRKTFGRSLVARHDLPEGTVLSKEHLTAKKPGLGIAPSRLNDILGRSLRTSVDAETILSEDHLA